MQRRCTGGSARAVVREVSSCCISLYNPLVVVRELDSFESPRSLSRECAPDPEITNSIPEDERASGQRHKRRATTTPVGEMTEGLCSREGQKGGVDIMVT